MRISAIGRCPHCPLPAAYPRQHKCRKESRLRRVASAACFSSAAAQSSRSVFYIIEVLWYNLKSSIALIYRHTAFLHSTHSLYLYHKVQILNPFLPFSYQVCYRHFIYYLVDGIVKLPPHTQCFTGITTLTGSIFFFQTGYRSQ